MAVFFNENQAKRVGNVVRNYERRPQNSIVGGPTISVSDPIREGITSSAITTRTLVSGVYTPGYGSAQFFDYDRDSNTVVLNDTEYDVLSMRSEEAPTDTEALFMWRAGRWWILSWECST